ncbi:unnamed protein product [Cunninghamella blakesleeana]
MRINKARLFIFITLFMVNVKSELLKCSGPSNKATTAISVTNQCCQSIQKTIVQCSRSSDAYCDVKEDIASFANCCQQKNPDFIWVDC